MATMKKMIGLTAALLVLLSMTALAATGRYDQQIQQAVSMKVHDSAKLQNVQSSIEDGIVTLTGTVNLYQDKLDAAKKVKKLANVTGVRNQISVAGQTVSDAQLQKTLSKKLAYDRVGYRDNAFNNLTLDVKDGTVTVGGETVNYVARGCRKRSQGAADFNLRRPDSHSHRSCDLSRLSPGTVRD
jgi:osmotically-inducible protein OsmY